MQLFTAGLAITGLATHRDEASSMRRNHAQRRTLHLRIQIGRQMVVICVSLFLSVMATKAIAQQITTPSSNNSSLPDAPVPQQGAVSTNVASPEEGSASVSGTVVDSTGSAIPGAQVSLILRDGRQLHTLVSGENGEFSFTKLPAGSYLVTVQAQGFAPFTSSEFSITGEQVYEVANVSLFIATASTDIVVRPTEVIAAEQIKAEEKQRLFGIVPNFYVSYLSDPAPLTAKQKFALATHDTFDWTSFVGISLTTGIEQANNAFAGYGQGAAGYGKRWAAKFGDGRSSDLFGHAVFPSLFHQDPRYFYQGTGTNRSRLMHALSHPFVTRSDSGHLMPNYSYLLGDMCSGALSNAYYPHADRGANLVFTNALVGLAGLAGATVLQEFIGKHLTKNVPQSAAPDTTQPALPGAPRPNSPGKRPATNDSNAPETGRPLN